MPGKLDPPRPLSYCFGLSDYFMALLHLYSFYVRKYREA